MGDAVGITLDGDGGGEAGDGDRAIELREGVVQGSLSPMAGGEEGDDDADDQERKEDGKYSEEDMWTRDLVRGLLADETVVEEWVRLGRFGFVLVHGTYSKV